MDPIGLLSWRPAHAIETLVGLSGLPLAAVNTTTLGMPAYRCPYGLPEIDGGPVVVVTSHWLYETASQGFDPVNDILLPLRSRFQTVIGYDHHDPITPGFSNRMMEHLDTVLKWNGVYRDRTLYSFAVGALSPAGVWTERVEPAKETLSSANLTKLVKSVPCFLNLANPVKRATRRIFHCSKVRRLAGACTDGAATLVVKLRGNTHPPYTAHFFAGLSHVQRAAAVQLLRKSRLKWLGGITEVPRRVAGYRGFGIQELTEQQRTDLTQELRGAGALVAPLPRLAYRASILRCKAVLSIVGYGEFCFRMAEAWANRRVLVCQDMSHIDSLYPFAANENVVYCKPDLSDLSGILEDIECNYHKYKPIAERGHYDWINWANKAARVVHEGFAPLYEPLETTPSSRPLTEQV